MIVNQLNKVLSVNAIKSMDSDKIENVRNLAKKNSYKAHTGSYIYYILQIRKAFELATVSHFTKDFTNGEKLIFISEVVFDDNEKFVKSLLEYFTIEELKKIDHSIKQLKKASKNKDVILEQDELLNRLEMFGKNFFGLPHTFAIINKIDTILALNPELLLTEETTKEKQKTLHY